MNAWNAPEEGVGLVLKLFGGRKDPEEPLESFGEVGPSLLVDEVTFGSCDSPLILFCNEWGDVREESLADLKYKGLFFYDGMYYSDVSITAYEERMRACEFFDPKKALGYGGRMTHVKALLVPDHLHVAEGDWDVTVAVDDDGHLNVYVTNWKSSEVFEVETGQGDGEGEQLAFRVTTREIEEEAGDE